MANLTQLLKQTLLLTAAPGLAARATPDFSPRQIADAGINGRSASPKKLASLPEDMVARKWIWHYTRKGLDEVRDVTCRVRTMGDMAMPVARRIGWGPVSVVLGDRSHRLPLTEDYLIRTYFLDGGDQCDEGVVSESSAGFWQLPMRLHSSYQLVFGYEMPRDRTNPNWQKVTPAAYNDWGFMSDSSAGPAFPVADTTGPGYTATELQLDPLRIAVVVTLGLTTEHYSFDPGGVLGAAKLFPVIMVVANMPVDEFWTQIELERDPTTTMTRMGEDLMNDEISAILFTDRNYTLPPPHWDNFFDYYDVVPPKDFEFLAVDPRAQRRQSDDGTVQVVDEDALRYREVHYKPRSFHKLPGQGEFDNLHIAPTMRAPDKVLYSIDDDRLRQSLKHVTMAPFCAHDCLHMHWRWAEFDAQKHVRGWDGFRPYAKRGAPLIPPNQELRIRLLDPGFRYVARALKPEAGQWQVFMHHGVGYSISTRRGLEWLGKTAELAKSAGPDWPWSWYAYYWRLRYAYGKAGFHERLLPGGPSGAANPEIRQRMLEKARLL